MSNVISICRTGSRRLPRPITSVSGFSLIELMIAMVLGLIVIAGAGSVFLASSRTYRTNQALSDVQTNSRIAFELLAMDLRDAGLSGCTDNGQVANVLSNGPNNGGIDWWANWNNAVHGYTGTQADPAVAFGTAAGERVAGTDSVQILGAGESPLSVQTNDVNAASFKMNETSTDLAAGDIILVCDPGHAALLQVTTYSSSTVTLTHGTGNGVTSPGNCSKGLGFPTVCTSNGNADPFGPNSQISILSADDWYIGNYVDASTGVKGKSLYRISLNISGGKATPTAQEMVRNVTAMTLTYHQTGKVNFVDASSVANWAAVDAVRVQLTLQSTDQRASTDVKPISRVFTATTTLRNRVN
jgi:type IV pilus assembly protein PilW